MVYTSVAEIYKAIDEPRERIYKRVESLNEEQANARPEANAWSATEIVEHLAIMEDRLVRMMKVMLKKAEGDSARSDLATPTSVKFNPTRSFLPTPSYLRSTT